MNVLHQISNLVIENKKSRKRKIIVALEMYILLSATERHRLAKVKQSNIVSNLV